jgi:hypothetical protein
LEPLHWSNVVTFGAHVWPCFPCVARTLDAEVEVAFVLTDLFDVANLDATAILGMTESAPPLGDAQPHGSTPSRGCAPS